MIGQADPGRMWLTSRSADANIRAVRERPGTGPGGGPLDRADSPS